MVVFCGACGPTVDASRGDGSSGTDASGSATTGTSGEESGSDSTTSSGVTTDVADGSSSDNTAADSSSTGFITQPDCGFVGLEDLPHGLVYLDLDSSDLSMNARGFTEPDQALEGVSLRLLGSDLEPFETCESGEYQFAADPGIYVVAPEAHQGLCSLRNCTTRFPVAIEEGQVKIVTLGDSVPVQGAAETFPARVAELVSAVAGVENLNLASSGTESSDWTPGGGLFEGARPDLVDADVVLISLGGNDVLNYVSTADLGDLPGVFAGAQATVDQVAVNVRDIASEIREENPDADVVFCLYPDYSRATQTSPWSDLGFIPPGVITTLLARARDAFTPEDDIVLVDLLGLTPDLPVPLDDYLADPLHFNDLGHDLYAHEVFRALGGVIVGESVLATPPVSLRSRQNFGYVE